jgi:lysyl-tRNA synthetase class 2
MAGRLTEILKDREIKIERLRELGIELYPARSKKEYPNREVAENFEKYQGQKVTLAGRITALRDIGKLAFVQILDQSGRIQLFLRSDMVRPFDKKEQRLGFGELGLLDLGDFVQAYGEIVKTKTGEVSVMVEELKLLTKSRRPLPDQWAGITDPDERYRRRYLDLLMGEGKKERFVRKAKFWSACREFMMKKGFVEVETPVLESVTGGADARPFVTHMNAIDQDFYLRISTELYQKRLMGAGFEKVFTLGPNFRNEGMDEEHLPEYYQLEWYWAYADYRDNMELVKEMYGFVAKEVYGKTKFVSHEMEYDLADEWTELDYAGTIKEKLGIDIFVSSETEMLEVIKKHGVKLGGEINKQRLIDNCWKIVRKTIAGPAFLINVPKFMSPLAKDRADMPGITERFQPIIAGSELGNGYSELNDPVDQRERFEEQQRAREAGDEEAQMMDMDYVEMLEYGMPPTSGYGFSERLFWFMEDVSGREATLFPPMRVKNRNEE